MRALSLIIALLLLACESNEPEPGRRLAHDHGAMVMNHTGFVDFVFAAARDERVPLRGGSEWMFVHPREPSEAPYREFVILFGAAESQVATLTPLPPGMPFELRVRARAEVPLDQRTLFTADVDPGRIHYVRHGTVIGDDGEPESGRVRLIEGAIEWDVFAADLATGATWGRFSGTLYADDGGEGPYTVSGEIAADALSLDCRWVVPSVIDPSKSATSRDPQGRDDLCNPAWEAIQATPAHPDAPPVPPFAEEFGNLPPRWPGLDRDL